MSRPSSLPAADGSCRTCGSALPDGASRCDHCGAVYGEANRCPHCNTVADVRDEGDGRVVCAVCGGPRLPLTAASISSSKSLESSLRAAQTDTKRSRLRGIGAGLLATVGVLGLGLTLLVWLIAGGAVAAIGSLFVTFLPWMLGFALARSAATFRKQSAAQVESAWLELAESAARDHAPLTARRAAELLAVPVSRAEELLAALTATSRLRSRISVDGELIYEPPGGLGARYRVEASADAEDLAESEAQADADAQAWVDAKQRSRR